MDRKDTNNSAATYTRFSGEEPETGVYTLEDEVTIPNHGSRHRSRLMWCSNNRRILLAGFVIFIIFCIGFIGGYLVRRSVHSNAFPDDCNNGNGTESPIDGATTTIATPTTDAIFKDIRMKMSPDLMKTNKREFGDGQHLAGSSWSMNLATMIHKQWSELGFQTTFKNYTVTLSSPGKNVLNITGFESILPTGILYNSLAGVPYSLDMSASGQPIFVNYGRYKDYKVLTETKNYNFELHSIALARMGKMSLSLMAKIAEEMNIKGMIVFADPTDYAPNVNYTDISMAKTKISQVFPKTVWLPGDTVVQDTMLPTMGDPFSPGFASGDQPGITLNQTSLTKIPVVSIGYETAYKIISNMQGAAPPKVRFPDWSGSFGEYHVEGSTTQNIVVNIDVDNKLEQKQITNVISTIKGSVEPEQYVIIGGHRDSVSVGSASPGTGVICLLEVARLLKFLIDNRKWKPYRSIMLVSWDAGASGQIGSTEWIEENLSLLQKSVVAYINLDDAVIGNYMFGASGSPLLSKVIYEASKNVDCPKHNEMNVYMDWKTKSVDKTIENKDPSLSIPGTGTDDSPFLHLAGVPTISPSYSYDKTNMRIEQYALYNTKLDTSQLVNMYDLNLDYHLAVIEVTLRVVYEIADKPVLPFSVVNYADVLLKGALDLQTQYQQLSSLEQLVSAATNFKIRAELFSKQVNESIRNDDTALYPSINYKLMSLEKMFLSKNKRKNFEDYRHLMLGPTLQKAYSGTVFAALSDALVQSETAESLMLEIVSSLMQASQLLSSHLP